MQVGLYARVSTRDKDQDPELQLVPMREYAGARGWDVTEYVDQAGASDFGRRTNWKRLLDDARLRRVALVVVWKLDRGFRSTVECLRTLEDWQARGVGFVCVSQPELDTTTPIGRLLLTVLAAVAEFERELIRERVREGMVNARRKGSLIGRPASVVKHPHVRRQWAELEPRLRAGELSQRKAASMLGVGRATVQRLLAAS